MTLTSRTGPREAVRAALDYIMEPLSLRVAPEIDIEPEYPTTAEEMLSDWQSVGLPQALIKDGEHPHVVRQAMDRAIEDLERTYTSYSKDWRQKTWLT